jgi:hypothetical protein
MYERMSHGLISLPAPCRAEAARFSVTLHAIVAIPHQQKHNHEVFDDNGT